MKESNVEEEDNTEDVDPTTVPWDFEINEVVDTTLSNK